jgi:urease accessory protein
VNVRLLQLASPALPVGAYSYSQGLEAAIEAGDVRDEASATLWIEGALALALREFEAPIFLRLADAWASGDVAGAARWNEEYLASREAAELRAETLQMGYSMRRLVRELDLPGNEALEAIGELSWPAAFAFAAAAWRIEAREALAAFTFSWIENQVLAAVKAIPLGQTAGQRMMLALGDRIPALVEHAASLDDDSLSNLAPGLAIACARHETQYTRIFRS